MSIDITSGAANLIKLPKDLAGGVAVSLFSSSTGNSLAWTIKKSGVIEQVDHLTDGQPQTYSAIATAGLHPVVGADGGAACFDVG